MMYAIVLLALSAPYAWEPKPDDPTTLQCWDGAGGHATAPGVWVAAWKLAGEYDTLTDTYRPFSATHGRCVTVGGARPPCRLPAVTNFGVASGSSLTESRCVIAGRLVDVGEVHDAVDRLSMPWLVACGGTKEQRKEALAKFPPDLLAKFRVASQDADHWSMRPGFKAGQPVSLYVLAADGEERHRQEDGDVAALVGILREPDPNYDPARSPDMRKPAWTALAWVGTPSKKSVTSASLVGACVLGGCFVVASNRRKNANGS